MEDHMIMKKVSSEDSILPMKLFRITALFCMDITRTRREQELNTCEKHTMNPGPSSPEKKCNIMPPKISAGRLSLQVQTLTYTMERRRQCIRRRHMHMMPLET